MLEGLACADHMSRGEVADASSSDGQVCALTPHLYLDLNK
jgi:hypothetical protein